jgi:hypothetical protein
MSYTFTIDEDIIRRLAHRHEKDEELGQARRRLSLFRFWHGTAAAGSEGVRFVPRSRWS